MVIKGLIYREVKEVILNLLNSKVLKYEKKKFW